MMPPIEKSLLALDPAFAMKVAEGLRRINARGHAILIYETFRSMERQAELYAQGRTTPGKIVTNAKPGESKHNSGRAIDCAPWEFLQSEGKSIEHKLDWTPFDHAGMEAEFKKSGDLKLLDFRWRATVEEFAAVGLLWAGRWKGKLIEWVHWESAD